jgi:hypothetical protein
MHVRRADVGQQALTFGARQTAPRSPEPSGRPHQRLHRRSEGALGGRRHVERVLDHGLQLGRDPRLARAIEAGQLALLPEGHAAVDDVERAEGGVDRVRRSFDSGHLHLGSCSHHRPDLARGRGHEQHGQDHSVNSM